MYGLADSTIRHYRATGRLRPTYKTPGGHARYAIADVLGALGEPAAMPAEPQPRALDGETFPPAGVHDLRGSGARGILAPEVVALAHREQTEAPRPAPDARWGGRLLTPRGRLAT
jgi:hypothetical protein